MALPQEAWSLWRRERDRLFAEHSQSPLAPAARAAFRGLDYFPYDPAFRVVAGLRSIDGETEQWQIGQDGNLGLKPFAETVGLSENLGRELTVYWITGYGGGLFLPFADATSGDETFGGGRYMLDTIKGADLGHAEDGLIIDFNFAYYPSCAHNDHWTCPLAPPANRVAARITAGQRG